MGMVFYFFNKSGVAKKIEREMLISNIFVIAAYLLIILSYSDYLDLINLPQINLNAAIFDFGLVSFFVGIFIMFIHMLRDPMYEYSPYVMIIGISLFSIYANIAIPIG
jgi:hypothetical protein